MQEFTVDSSIKTYAKLQKIDELALKIYGMIMTCFQV